jgi:hypothetical protein
VWRLSGCLWPGPPRPALLCPVTLFTLLADAPQVYVDSFDKARRLEAALKDVYSFLQTGEVQEAEVHVANIVDLPVSWREMIVARRGDYVGDKFAQSPNADDAVSSASSRSRPASVVEASDSLGQFQAVDSLSAAFPKYVAPRPCVHSRDVCGVGSR